MVAESRGMCIGILFYRNGFRKNEWNIRDKRGTIGKEKFVKCILVGGRNVY